MKNSIATPDKNTDKQFWVDLPEENSVSPILTKSFPLFKFYMIFINIIIALIPISLILILLGPGYAIAFILLIVGSIVYGLYLRRQKQAELKEKEQIQVHASELTAADTLGSAIHVAGHPLFERDQPVVLALKNDELAIHTYQSQVPKDVIKISNIKAVYTVVYDDDRIPHIDVIDNTAQALQMMIAFNSKDYSCLFRRFRKVRAIDWYHELQRAKFNH